MRYGLVEKLGAMVSLWDVSFRLILMLLPLKQGKIDMYAAMLHMMQESEEEGNNRYKAT